LATNDLGGGGLGVALRCGKVARGSRMLSAMLPDAYCDSSPGDGRCCWSTCSGQSGLASRLAHAAGLEGLPADFRRWLAIDTAWGL